MHEITKEETQNLNSTDERNNIKAFMLINLNIIVTSLSPNQAEQPGWEGVCKFLSSHSQ